MNGDSFGGHRNNSSHSNSVATPTDSTMNMDTLNSLNSSTEPRTNRTLPDVHTEKQATPAEFVFQQPYQPKRLRVSDINVSRYEEEFVELEEIASGVFGKVMVARHRLDGMVYAIKVTQCLNWYCPFSIKNNLLIANVSLLNYFSLFIYRLQKNKYMGILIKKELQ